MSLPPPGPGLGPLPVVEARRAARLHAQRISAGLALVFGIGAALVLVLAFVVLDYRMGLQAHRLVKILIGAGAGGGILIFPRVGLFLMPVAVPFLGWLPRLPLPGVNVLNLLLFTVFSTWGLTRIFAHQPIVRRTRLGGLLMAIVIVAGLSIVRGSAFPTGYRYNGQEAAYGLVRSVMTFAFYFLAFWMVRGPQDRRRMTWGILIGLLLESLVTISHGRSGRGGRAEGTFGQANDLGAFLAMFTPLAAAQFFVVRRWLARVTLAGAVFAGTFATILTVSRGAILALGLALLLVTWRTSRFLVLVLLAVMFTSPLWVPDYLKERVMGTRVENAAPDDVALENSSRMRVHTWRALFKVVEEHPLDGVGFAGLIYVLPETGEELGVDVKESAHNTYLRFVSEMGVVGLGLFLALLWRCWSLARLGQRLAKDRADRQLALGLTAATLALAISCAFGDRFFSPLLSGNFWLLCALVDDLVTERKAELA
jgi:hypothetical protein